MLNPPNAVVREHILNARSSAGPRAESGMTGHEAGSRGCSPYGDSVRRSLFAGALAVSLVLIGGCSGGDRFTGVVTTTSPRLCLGRPDASGDCFVVDAKLLSALKMNECVTVTYQARANSDPGPRGEVTAVERSDECSRWR